MEIIKYSELDKWISSLKEGTKENPLVYDVEVKDIPDNAFMGDVEKALPSEFGMKFTKAKSWTFYNLTFNIPESVDCVESCFNAEKFNIPLKSVKVTRAYKPISFPKEIKEKFSAEEIKKWSLDAKNFTQDSLNKVFLLENDGWMFYGCKDLEFADISGLSRMRTGCAMFSGCTSLKEVNTGKLEYLTNARSMFSGCKNLQGISFDNLPNIKITKSMLGGAVKLRNLDCRGVNSVGSIYSVS